MDETSRNQIADIMRNVRACMKDHGVTVGELATLAGKSPHKLRLQLINGDLSFSVCSVLRERTGDMRAFGIPADYVSTGTLDEAIALLARPDADQILAEAP